MIIPLYYLVLLGIALDVTVAAAIQVLSYNDLQLLWETLNHLKIAASVLTCK